jgi:hypothetical protein
MNRSLSPTRAEPDPKTGDASDLRQRLEIPVLLGGAGGLGLLACIACCTLPILGAIGIGSGAMAFFQVLEPLSAGLLALGGIAAAVTFVRFRKSGCAATANQNAACAADGSCGCGSSGYRLSGPAER